ncbi:MAG: hypothetical protein U0670_07860 [Anaerolineae bacterium]
MENPMRLEDAFETCIELLANGVPLENCLRRFPQYANELRPMLEAGLAVRRAAYPTSEARDAQNRVRFRVAGALESAFTAEVPPRGAVPSRRASSAGASLLLRVAAFSLVFFAGVVITVLLMNRGTGELIPASQPTDTPTAVITETSTPTLTETATQTPTQTATSTATATQTASATANATASATAAVTTTHTAVIPPTSQVTLQTIPHTATLAPPTPVILTPVPTTQPTDDHGTDSPDDHGGNSGSGSSGSSGSDDSGHGGSG